MQFEFYFIKKKIWKHCFRNVNIDLLGLRTLPNVAFQSPWPWFCHLRLLILYSRLMLFWSIDFNQCLRSLYWPFIDVFQSNPKNLHYGAFSCTEAHVAYLTKFEPNWIKGIENAPLCLVNLILKSQGNSVKNHILESSSFISFPLVYHLYVTTEFKDGTTSRVTFPGNTCSFHRFLSGK